MNAHANRSVGKPAGYIHHALRYIIYINFKNRRKRFFKFASLGFSDLGDRNEIIENVAALLFLL